MIEFHVSQSGPDTEAFLRGIMKADIPTLLATYGAQGVAALRAHTPVDSGMTAMSWNYEVVKESNGWAVIWSNSNVEDGVPVAILIQFDHATGTGGFVQGREYINTALKPIFERIEAEIGKVVSGR